MSAEYVLRLREAHRAIGDLLKGIDWSSFDRCECGHLRIEHHAPPAGNGHEPCARRECHCKEYDDFNRGHQNPLRAA